MGKPKIVGQQHFYSRKRHRIGGVLLTCVHVLLSCVLTRLVSNTTASLASRLARSLTFATAAVFCAFAKILCFKCLNSFHYSFLQRDYFLPLYHGKFKKSRCIGLLYLLYFYFIATTHLYITPSVSCWSNLSNMLHNPLMCYHLCLRIATA